MNNSTIAPHPSQFPGPVKLAISVLPCLVCFYINGVMLFALLRKPLLLESPRYVLFGHLLLTDSLQLLVTMMLVIFGVTGVRMISYVCIVITMLAAIIVQISPLNLAVMSLERYVAICFPLRHSDIVNPKRTRVAIAVIWTVGSIDSVIQLLLFFCLENTKFVLSNFCIRSVVFQLRIYLTINTAFTILYFVTVCIIIIYTYIAIIMVAKSASSNNQNATKAHKTVLLHLFQLGLYLTSSLFNMIISNSRWSEGTTMGLNFQYTLFIVLIVFPKCLSPLIYGLRDQTLRHVFKYYIAFGFRITVRISPKF